MLVVVQRVNVQIVITVPNCKLGEVKRRWQSQEHSRYVSRLFLNGREKIRRKKGVWCAWWLRFSTLEYIYRIRRT